MIAELERIEEQRYKALVALSHLTVLSLGFMFGILWVAFVSVDRTEYAPPARQVPAPAKPQKTEGLPVPKLI